MKPLTLPLGKSFASTLKVNPFDVPVPWNPVQEAAEARNGAIKRSKEKAANTAT